MTSTSIDVIICTYNNAAILDQTLTAIAAQTGAETVDWGVWVVDNNCTDDTTQVLEWHLKSSQIPQLRVIKETKQGLSHARHAGINASSREWIAFVDDDCVLEPEWIQEAARFASKHPACGAFGGCNKIAWEVPPTPFIQAYQTAYAAQDLGPDPIQFAPFQYPVGAGVVLRRKALLESGWNERQLLVGREGKALSAGDDTEIAIRIQQMGYELWFTPDCVLHHQIPKRRITDKYLISMSFGFGQADPYLRSMAWQGSYFGWLVPYLFAFLLRHAKIAIFSILSFLGFIPKNELLIRWSIIRGQWTGLKSLTWTQYDRIKNLQSANLENT